MFSFYEVDAKVLVGRL